MNHLDIIVSSDGFDQNVIDEGIGIVRDLILQDK